MTTGGSPDKLNLTPLTTEHRPQDAAGCRQCRVLGSRPSDHRCDEGRGNQALPDRPTGGATRLDTKKEPGGYPENIYETRWSDVGSIVKDVDVGPEEDKVTLGDGASRPPHTIEVPGNKELDMIFRLAPHLPEMAILSISNDLQQLLGTRRGTNYEPTECGGAQGFGPGPRLSPNDISNSMGIGREPETNQATKVTSRGAYEGQQE